MSTPLHSLTAFLALARAGHSSRSAAALERRHGSLASAVAELPDAARPRSWPSAEALALERLGVTLVSRSDPMYPAPLAEIDDSPDYLFRRGSLSQQDDPAVAIVGSRRATPEGLRIARTLASSLAAAGVCVVSGLARGIDRAAHEGALEAGGRTLAVLGSGIDVVYPRQHLALAERVAAAGALLSELPPGAAPSPWNFPRRNRILAGLSRVVVVVEAAERSGSLITARIAVEQNRAVLAVPGSPLSEAHRGTNRLIRAGEAGLLQALEDVFEELPLPHREALSLRLGLKLAQGLTDTQRRVLEALSPDEPRHLDAIAARLGFEAKEVSVTLVELEIQEQAARVAGGRYLRLRDAACLTRPPAPGDTSAPAVLSSGGSSVRKGVEAWQKRW